MSKHHCPDESRQAYEDDADSRQQLNDALASWMAGMRRYFTLLPGSRELVLAGKRGLPAPDVVVERGEE